MSDKKVLIICVIVFVISYVIGYANGYLTRLNKNQGTINDNSEDLDYHI